MKVRLITAITILALLLMATPPSGALAGAYETSFVTSITYQNADTAATTNLRIYFYDSPSDTTPIEIIRPNLNAGASTSLFIGGLSEISPGFRGTAVLASDKRMIATLVQLPQNSTTVKVRPLSNGFAAGSANSLIASVLKNQFTAQQYTIFSVQNAGTSATDVAIKFYNTANPPVLVHTINTNLQPGAGYFVNTGDVAALGSGFNGSVVIESTGGSIISSAMELDSNGVGGKAFEGLGAGATTFYMPSALCKFRVSGQATEHLLRHPEHQPDHAHHCDGDLYTRWVHTDQPTASVPAPSSASPPAAPREYHSPISMAPPSSPARRRPSSPWVKPPAAGSPPPSSASPAAQPRSDCLTSAGPRPSSPPAPASAPTSPSRMSAVAIGGNILVKYIDPNGTVVGTHTIAGLGAGAESQLQSHDGDPHACLSSATSARSPAAAWSSKPRLAASSSPSPVSLPRSSLPDCAPPKTITAWRSHKPAHRFVIERGRSTDLPRF